MTKKLKTYFNWSSGKDASLALYHLKKDDQLNIDKLLTSISLQHQRVSMHGLRKELIEQQAQSIGLAIEFLELPEGIEMEGYNQIMSKTVKQLKKEGYSNCAFGDIFLEDLREYREEQLKPYAISCHFPLWKRDTKEVIKEFISLGFKAIVTCVNSDLLDDSFVGRELNESFINDLPSNVDPCGENGEFHTFCYDGPLFAYPIQFTIGEKVYKEYKQPKNKENGEKNKNRGFCFIDLLAKQE